jgi:hypothetical protein
MPLLELLRSVFKRSPKAQRQPHRDMLCTVGDVITFQCGSHPAVSIRARDVVAVWYDYNPYGWMHANSLRIVYMLNNQSASINVYDEQHTFTSLLPWLQQHFPSSVANRYRSLWSSAGGDELSIQLWAAHDGGT